MTADLFLPNAQDQTLQEELDRIARNLPGIPADYRELRALAQLLQTPTGADPDVPRGGPDPFPQGGALNIPSLLGTAPGSTAAGTLGALAPPVFGLHNILVDSQIRNFADVNCVDGLERDITIPGATTQPWYATFSPSNGQMAIADVYPDANVIGTDADPFLTNLLAIRHGGTTAAGTWTTRLRIPISVGFNPQILPYFNWSLVVFKSSANVQDFSNITAANLTIRIRNAADSADLSAPVTVDFLNLASGSGRRVDTSFPSNLYTTGVYLVIELVTTASGTNSSQFVVDIANPLFELTFTGQATFYLPPASSGGGDDFLAYSFYTY